MRAFNLARRRDTNIETAVSDNETALIVYYWGVPAVINTLSPELVDDWSQKLGQPPYKARVPSLRLETILDRHLPASQLINFLSIDVEGHDLEVLRSNNWTRYRPRLIVIEQHGDDIRQILVSNVTRFLEGVGYSLYSWVKLSVIYRADYLLEP